MPYKDPRERYACQLRWNSRNPDKMAEYRRRWNSPDRLFANHLARCHGWTVDGYAAMIAAQDGRCYLCGDLLPASSKNIHIDHDHRCCGKGRSCSFCRRGIACQRCNHAVGLALDNPDRLRRIADNLETAQRTAIARIAAKPEALTLFDEAVT